MESTTIQNKIKGSIEDIFSIALNKWISVKDISITSIFKDHHISKCYYTPIMTVLKSKGLLFTEGVKGGMRYKYIPGDSVIQDLDSIAQEVIEYHRNEQDNYNGNRPKAPKKYKEWGSESKTRTIHKEPLQLGTTVYFVYENKITEGVIHSSELSSTPGRLYEYSIQATIDNKVIKIYGNDLAFFTTSMASLIEYLTKGVIKYDTVLVQSYIKERFEKLQQERLNKL